MNIIGIGRNAEGGKSFVQNGAFPPEDGSLIIKRISLRRVTVATILATSFVSTLLIQSTPEELPPGRGYVSVRPAKNILIRPLHGPRVIPNAAPVEEMPAGRGQIANQRVKPPLLRSQARPISREFLETVYTEDGGAIVVNTEVDKPVRRGFSSFQQIPEAESLPEGMLVLRRPRLVPVQRRSETAVHAIDEVQTLPPGNIIASRPKYQDLSDRASFALRIPVPELPVLPEGMAIHAPVRLISAVRRAWNYLNAEFPAAAAPESPQLGVRFIEKQVLTVDVWDNERG